MDWINELMGILVPGVMIMFVIWVVKDVIKDLIDYAKKK